MQIKGVITRTKGVVVRLSLLTMTNPNQLCDVLLFVCSKMADETNLSSKLPVADRTREVWRTELCWWSLSSGFPLCTFLLASLILFGSYSSAPLLKRSCHFVRSCAICSHDSVGMLKSLREALRVSLYRFFFLRVMSPFCLHYYAFFSRYYAFISHYYAFNKHYYAFFTLWSLYFCVSTSFSRYYALFHVNTTLQYIFLMWFY